MKKNNIVLALCLLIEFIIIGQLSTTIDTAFLSKTYMKIGAIILNTIIFIWGCVLIRGHLESSVPIKTVLTLIIAIAANLFFGIYHESFFYTNLVLLGILFEFFLSKK